ncbi:MAG: hypothetical protein KDA36_10430 [Planctomycetaceae bacterium]|nr:hypothetical protein [Planctomycetaceae bacterium]
MSMPLNADYLRLYSPGPLEADEVDQPELRLWSDTTGLALLSDDEAVDEDGRPMIFQFRRPHIGYRPQTQEQLLTRTKIVHRNRCCRYCDSPSVVPIQRNDAVMNRNGMPIPGTATLVGFRCRRCSAEWRV